MLVIFIEGVKLMVFGMGFVFVYLILLVYLTKLVSYFFANPDLKLVVEPKTLTLKEEEDKEIISAITSAIIVHKSKNS
jgi:oxaloacetate decarboxylase gamma subunit